MFPCQFLVGNRILLIVFHTSGVTPSLPGRTWDYLPNSFAAVSSGTLTTGNFSVGPVRRQAHSKSL